MEGFNAGLIDFAPLEGLHFSCLHGCGVCCAFRPQVGPFELAGVGADPEIGPALVMQKDDEGCEEHYLPLSGRAGSEGACKFLDDKLLCGVYARRPFKCRLFPFYLRFGMRVQADVDLACPGMWGAGARPAAQELSATLSSIDLSFCAPLRDGARKAQTRTVSALDGMGLLCAQEVCRRELAAIAQSYTTPGGLDRVIRAAGAEPEMRDADCLARFPHAGSSLSDAVAAELADNAFRDRVRPVDHPLFLNERLEWRYLEKDGEIVTARRLGKRGESEDVGRAMLPQQRLLPLSPEQAGLLSWYLGILNSRDSLYDFALLSSERAGGVGVLASYLHSAALFAIDAWAMAQVYSAAFARPFDRIAMQKGIQAVDNSRVTGPAFDVL